MTTLKGLFDPKPRSQRNFLLENKRDVKTKSTSNSQKHQRELNLPQKQGIPLRLSKTLYPLSTVLKSSGLGQKQKGKGSAHLIHPPTTSQQPKKVSPGKVDPCRPESKPTGDCLSSKPTSNPRTMQYSHKENVPFEWTEVCPSLISHNICHQGVQTDRDEKYDVNDPQTQRFNVSDMCDQKHVQIHKRSFDGNSENTEGRKHDPKEGAKSGNYHDNEQTGNRSEVALEGYSNALNCPGGLQASKGPDYKSSNLISDIENLKLSPSRKTLSNAKATAATMPYPLSYRKGVVPGYISKRKAEALASALTKEVDPNCPLGHIVMPDDERRETLDMILKNYNQLIAELNKIPVRTDTLKMKQRKIEIEKQLDKLEEGIRIFSRSKVYVKVDA